MRPLGTRPLRIAVWHNLPSGGGKRALFEHVKGLLSRGHTVEVWSPSTADETYLALGKLCPEHIMPLVGAAPRVRFLWQRLLLPSRRMRLRLAAMDKHSQSCATEINQGRFDVLFANSCRFFRTTSIARYADIPSLIYLGEPYRWFYEALPDPPWAALPRPAGDRLGYLWRVGADILVKQAHRLQMLEEVNNAASYDRILVNSLFSRESVLRAYGLDSCVCYPGIDLERFRPTGEEKQGFVLGLGGLYVGKGPDRAIRALATIESQRRPRFVWVGNFANQQYGKEMGALAQSLGVSFEVKINIPDPDLVSLLSRASVLLYTPRLEPFGLAPLEANACGTTVVAIAEGGVRESIRPGVNGMLVQDDNPHKLGKLVAEIVSSQQLAAELGSRARQYVQERWSVQNGVDELERNLTEIAQLT